MTEERYELRRKLPGHHWSSWKFEEVGDSVEAIFKDQPQRVKLTIHLSTGAKAQWRRAGDTG